MEVLDIKKASNKIAGLDEGVKMMCKRWDKTKLPDDLFISTVTILCKIGTPFNLKEISTKLELKPEKIIYIRGMGVFKSLKSKKQKIIGSCFHNQVSVGVFSDKIVSIKLFLNGSIQITGCKSIRNAVNALKVLFSELKNDLYTLNKIHDLRVVMINSNFNIGFKIDRMRLFNLIKEKYICNYDPTIHACVDIKLECTDKVVSIFVFESGSIVITGANSLEHVIKAHDFISKFLLENYKKILRREPLTNSIIMMYMK